MTTEPTAFPAPTGTPAVDPLTAERLARLAARRAGTPTPAAPRPLGSPVPAGARTGRRHAAKGSRAAALMMSLATTGGLGALFAHQAAASTAAAAPAALPAAGSATTGAVAATAAPVAAGSVGTPVATAGSAAATTAAAAATTAAVASPGASGAGTFDGSAVSTKYGTVQVAITTAGGKITDVVALALPSGGKNTAYSNKSAPVLRTEALAGQSASIDIVSGATYTSKGYLQSLQVAIDEAVTAGALAG